MEKIELNDDGLLFMRPGDSKIEIILDTNNSKAYLKDIDTYLITNEEELKQYFIDNETGWTDNFITEMIRVIKNLNCI